MSHRRFAHTAILLGSFLLVGPVPARTSAENGGTIRVAANYYSGGADRAQREAVARTHDLVVLGTGWADTGPPLGYREVNPDVVLLEYQGWFNLTPGSAEYEMVSREHEDWFYHDAQGRRIAVFGTGDDPGCDVDQCPADPAFCNCRFGLDLGNPELRAHVAQRLQDLVTAGGAYARDRAFDGIMLDNTFPSWPYRPGKIASGWVTATPVAADGTPQTEASWVDDQKGFLAAMKAAIGPGKQLAFNGCAASPNYPSWQANSYAYLEHADGCTMEHWTVNGSGTAATAKTGSTWRSDLALFQGVNARGKWSFPLIGSGVHSPAVNRYGIASALLVASGPRSSMNFWRGTAEEAIAGRFPTTFPEALVDLGTAFGMYRTLPSGVVTRGFTAGRVWVNPTSTTQTISLDEPMRTLAGQLVTSITLGPGRAEVLTVP